MSGERFFSTLASVGILLAAGMFVMLTSLAALNAASLSAGAETCNYRSCISVASNF